MTINTVHVVFKTHLDVGFTDFAERVVQRYFTDFIPHSIKLAQQVNVPGEAKRFCWTVPSWIIYEYLERASPDERRLLEKAIEAGDIVWHALPFTLHSELADESLFRFGLSLSKELDTRFGRETIAAKMTDVPGHTRAIVLLLAEAGVELLHIGVNPAASPPDVPPVFIWKDEATSTSIVVMYHTVYGDVTTIPGLDEAVALVLTGDNLGPPTLQQIDETHAMLQQRFPGAKVIASTLDDFARKLRGHTANLPVLTEEIGDTWIHGAGTDPTKVSQYRALLRLRKKWLEADAELENESAFKAFSRALLLIPEHTWGLDEKTHLNDPVNYTNEQLTQARKTPRYQNFEASWQEQRAYLDQALAALEGKSYQQDAQNARDYVRPARPDVSGFQATDTNAIETQHFSAAWDTQTGAIIHLEDKTSGNVWSDQNHPLALFSYEVFGTQDYDRYWAQYIRASAKDYDWAYEDNMKPGLPVEQHHDFQAMLLRATQADTEHSTALLMKIALPEASYKFGAPKEIYLQYAFPAIEPRIDITLSWFQKTACRIPEAFWLSFQPKVAQPEQWRLSKLGQRINPRHGVNRGARTLHASDYGAFYDDGSSSMRLHSTDAPLFAPGRRSLLDFTNALPDLSGGWHINLYNNIWGTNFPMWFEDDAVFRFSLVFSP